MPEIEAKIISVERPLNSVLLFIPLPVRQHNTCFLVHECVHMFVYACVKRIENRIIASSLCVCIENNASICWKDTLIIIFFFCIDLLSPNE